MKYFLPFLVFVIALASCKQGADRVADRKIELLVDSTVYQNNNIHTDTIAMQPEAAAPVSQTSHKTHSVKPKKQAVSHTPKRPARAPVVKQERTETVPPVVNSGAPSETAGTGNLPAGVPGEVKKDEKKGWSKAAQGAVIGGAAGAVGGAIISKKKGLGAVIGGVVGAAGGYIIGKNKDKKEATQH